MASRVIILLGNNDTTRVAWQELVALFPTTSSSFSSVLAPVVLGTVAWFLMVGIERGEPL